jgi:hypothetical protein
MTKKEIKICDYCATPLIWTFLFPYKEYYCLNCGRTWGMLGAGKNVEITKELILKRNIAETIFKQLHGKGWLLPQSTYGYTKCKVEKNCRNHNEHLTKKEIEWNEVAWKMLEQVKGVFDNKLL